MYEQIQTNIRRTWGLIFVFILVIAAIGYLFGEITEFGLFAIPVAIGIAIISVWGSYFYSDRLILSMSRARLAKKQDHPHLYHTVEGLAIAAGLPKPKLYIIDDSAPNAFATGRNPEHAVIAVTTGLLDKLNRVELEGVVAHEMAHIQNYDILLSTVVVTLVGLVTLLSDWMFRLTYYRGRFGSRRSSRRGRGGGGAEALILLAGIAFALLAPVLAQLIRLAISRRREFLADASGALLTRYPPGLASALRKIAADPEPLEVANKATAHLYIYNPLRDYKSSFVNELWSTHPPVEDRITALERM